MKRFALVAFALCAGIVGQVFAQGTDIVTLNDSNPVLDIQISQPPHTTGVVALDFSMASVQVMDASNAVVFSSADARVHALELSIAPDTGTHTLHIERLPGVGQAVVQVSSQADLTPANAATTVNASTLSLQQTHMMELNPTNPGGQTEVSIPQNSTGVITATFPGAAVTSQVAARSGAVVASSYRDIDGFNLVIDGGTYSLSLLANPLDHSINAGVSVTPSNAFTLLAQPQTVAVQAVQPAQAVQAAQPVQPCVATIAALSANLRSGPGTAYTVLGYGFVGDSLLVGGVNPENNWLVVGDGQNSAWMSSDAATLSGDCGNLAVFNVPLRDAQAAPPAQRLVVPGLPSGESEEHDDHGFESEGDD